MTRLPRPPVAGLLAASFALVLSGMTVLARQAPAAAVPLSEQVFKNIQVMKGVPADQFMGTMGYMSNALSVNCTYCHLGDGGGGWGEYARDNDKKVTARRMISMMNEINKTYFAGRRVVTCVSCHNGSNRPKVTSNMSVYYSVPNTDEPDQILKQAPGSPSAEQILDKYIQAIGGAARLAALTSWTAKGTHLAYGEAEKRPLQIFARAPMQRVEIQDTGNGNSTTVYDGKAGWSLVPDAITPLPFRALTGAELEGARLDAVLAFPGQIKTALTGWRGAIPATMGDTDVYVVQGTMAGNVPVKLYFDFDSGLLVRQIRYTETPLGRNTWQIDYSDYEEVAGVKMPTRWLFMWQSGKVEVELTDVEPNVVIDAARFSLPAR